jgi:SAM-dependent methyltransferase
MMGDPKDPFSRANYRSLIAWDARIEREAPFLERAFAALPDRSVADLGCGTGEHARHFAARGYRVAGLDASESMIESALEQPLPPNLRFVVGDMREGDKILGEKFGAALCLGNTLPFFLTEEDLRQALGAVSRLLLLGGRFLFQILNYERLYARGVRHLPLNFRPSDDGEIVFVRILDLRPGGRVVFMPTTLQLNPEREEPVRVVRTRRVELRAWTRTEILPALEAAGFTDVELFGTMEGQAFDPMDSSDLVVLCSSPRDEG